MIAMVHIICEVKDENVIFYSISGDYRAEDESYNIMICIFFMHETVWFSLV